jgi:hypothetical protein
MLPSVCNFAWIGKNVYFDVKTVENCWKCWNVKRLTRCDCSSQLHSLLLLSLTSHAHLLNNERASPAIASLTPKTLAIMFVCVCVCVFMCVCLVMGERLKKRTEKRSFRVELVRVDQKSLSLLILATFLNSFVRLLVCLFVCLFNWLTDMSKKENVASNIRNNNSEQIVLQLISRTS